VGHGFWLFSKEKCAERPDKDHFVNGLVEYVAKRRILLEVRLT
jgi:hypothetical protein